MNTTDELIHCIYSSRAVADFDEPQLADLLARARAKNRRLNVTGMLLYDARSFFQVLEGPVAAVVPLFAEIRVDPRHDRVAKLIQEPIEARAFGEWSMGIGRVSSQDLSSIPALNDFFGRGHSLDELDTGRAKRLLAEFKGGRWRQSLA